MVDTSKIIFTRDNSIGIKYTRPFSDDELDYTYYVELNYSSLPPYLINEIKKQFNYDYDVDGTKPCETDTPILKYDNWTIELKYWVRTLWPDTKENVLKRAIDYAQDCLHFHRNNCDFCDSFNDCEATEIWKLRIVIAATILNDIVPNAGVPIFYKFYGGYEIPIIELPKIRPIFNPENIPDLLYILKKHFHEEDYARLKKIIEGENLVGKLLFISNGNRLADAFKQLYEGMLITGCQKIELEGWIIKNFYYRYKNEVKQFTNRYLNDIISSNTKICKNPILKVVKDKTTGNYHIQNI